jgi:hypothetical protein
MDSHRIEIFHVANRDAVIIAITDDFIFDFLPSLQVFFDENLAGEGKGLLNVFAQFCLIVGYARSQSTQGLGHSGDDGIADILCCLQGIIDGCYRSASGNF